MENKRKQEGDDLKGFEEFIEGQPEDSSFLTKQAKKEASFEHFTFLTNDSNRLTKVKDLLMNKLPFATRHEQGGKLIQDQTNEIQMTKKHLFEFFAKPNSAYKKSLQEIFDSFFEPPKS